MIASDGPWGGLAQVEAHRDELAARIGAEDVHLEAAQERERRAQAASADANTRAEAAEVARVQSDRLVDALRAEVARAAELSPQLATGRNQVPGELDAVRSTRTWRLRT